MKENFITLAETGSNDSGKRADTIFRKLLPGMPLSAIYREIRNGRLRINSRKISPSWRVSAEDTMEIHISLGSFISASEKEKTVQINGKTDPEGFINSILFENSDIIIINKKRGELVHSGDKEEKKPTLEQLVNRYLSGKIEPSLTFRPGPLHRIDRNTSGIVVFGKSIEGARVFSQLLREGKTEKKYIALFDGIIRKEVTWENTIIQDKNKKKSVAADDIKHGKAVTTVKPIVSGRNNTLAFVTIPTGKYHQIRKQGELNSHPLTGDSKYRGSSVLPFYLLHAYQLSVSEDDLICNFKTVKAPLPDYFIKNLKNIFNEKELPGPENF